MAPVKERAVASLERKYSVWIDGNVAAASRGSRRLKADFARFFEMWQVPIELSDGLTSRPSLNCCVMHMLCVIAMVS